MRSCFALACVALAAAVGGSAACRRSPAAGSSPETATAVPSEVPAADAHPDESARPPVTGSNSSYHDEFCRPERYEGFASDFPCTFDSECVPCECRPVNRAEHARLGGDAWCERFNQPPAREECIATNPACCDGRCVLAR
ncbi:MAG: hypothetical protein JXB32_10220 [Deltaproteobacteria bacterium]|nr:hypothetical protein [Deltaproteobacteria bacterium]